MFCLTCCNKPAPEGVSTLVSLSETNAPVTTVVSILNGFVSSRMANYPITIMGLERWRGPYYRLKDGVDPFSRKTKKSDWVIAQLEAPKVTLCFTNTPVEDVLLELDRQLGQSRGIVVIGDASATVLLAEPNVERVTDGGRRDFLKENSVRS